MADYYPLLAKAVAGLPQSTPETRRAIYDRARKALLGQLRSITPPVPEPDVERESQALDDAIAQIERELAPPPPPVEPPPVELPPLEIPVEAKAEPVIEAIAEPPAEPTMASEPAAAPAQDAAPKNKERPVIRPSAPMPSGERPAAPERPAIRPIPPLPPIPTRIPAAPGKARIPAPPPIKIAGPMATGSEAPPVVHDMAEESVGIEPLQVDANDSATAFDSLDSAAIKTEPIRPAAPQPPRMRSSKLRYGILTAALLVIVGGVAVLAYKLKDKPEDILRSRPPQPVAEQPDSPSKIVERIGAGQTPTAPTRPTQPAGTAQRPAANPPADSQPAIPVAQRAALLVDAPEDPQKFKTFVGSAVWRLESVSRGPGQPLTQAIRAEADIPDAKLKVTMLLQMNSDENLPASHTMTIRVAPAADSPFPPVEEIDLPQMRNEVSPSVDSLFGVQAKIMPGMFLVGLTREQSLLVRNLEMIKMRGWIDIPMRFADGRVAKVTLEKGPAGDRVVTEAFASWGQ